MSIYIYNISTCTYHTLSWAYRLLVTATEMQRTLVDSALPSMPMIAKRISQGWKKHQWPVETSLSICNGGILKDQSGQTSLRCLFKVALIVWMLVEWEHYKWGWELPCYMRFHEFVEIWLGMAVFRNAEVDYFFEGPTNIPSGEVEVTISSCRLRPKHDRETDWQAGKPEIWKQRMVRVVAWSVAVHNSQGPVSSHD